MIHYMEQGSPEWAAIRIGKVTGSNFKKVMASDNLPYVDILIAEMLTGQTEDDDYMNWNMERGVDLEPIAVQEYKKLWPSIDLVPVGFVQVSELVGYSPDQVVIVDGEIIGGIEVKCPTSKKHIQHIRQARIPSDHKWQVYFPFIVSDKVEWWDFVSFDPRVSQVPIFTKKVYRDDIQAEIKEGRQELDKFLNKLNKYHDQILFPV